MMHKIAPFLRRLFLARKAAVECPIANNLLSCFRAIHGNNFSYVALVLQPGIRAGEGGWSDVRRSSAAVAQALDGPRYRRACGYCDWACLRLMPPFVVAT